MFVFLDLLFSGELFHCYMLSKSICHFRGDRSILLLFVAPALARCDIGVQFSVRPSVRLSVHNLCRP